MRIAIPYDTTEQIADIPDENLCAVLAPAHKGSTPLSGEEIVRRAMENPYEPRLSGLVAGKKRVLIIASDHTRPVPSRVIIPPMLEEIRQASPDAEVIILIATGAHRAPTHEELIYKFGPEIVEKEDIRVHRCDAKMVKKGMLPSGTELWVNELVDWADFIAAEGFIEPHFFAGFSGGRKSILPGIASKVTIFGNHCAKFIAHPKARAGVLDGNPVHEDMAFAADAVGLKYIVNVTIDSKKNIVEAFAGDAKLAHEAGCRAVLDMYRVRAVEGDVVITSNGGYPLDQDIYQSVKSMTAAEACVREGGVIIVCASCRNGHGGENFIRYFAQGKSAQDIYHEILCVEQERTVQDQWQAQMLARVLLRAEVIMVCDESVRPLVTAMGLRYAPTLEEAVRAAYSLGRGQRTVVIPDGVGVIVE